MINFEVIKEFKSEADKIGQISDNKFLFMYNQYFKIINLDDNSEIFRSDLAEMGFELNKYSEIKYYNHSNFQNFYVLKNEDLLLWTGMILFYYKKEENKYILYQSFNQFNEEEKPGLFQNYINNVLELDNDSFITCNTFGIRIYKKKNNKYNLVQKIKIFLEVYDCFKINQDLLLLVNYKDTTINSLEHNHSFAISLFDMKTNNVNIIYKKEIHLQNPDYIKIFDFFLEDKLYFQFHPVKSTICKATNGGLYFEFMDNEKKELNILDIKRKKRLEITSNYKIPNHYKNNLFFCEKNNQIILCSIQNNNIIPVYEFKIKESEAYYCGKYQSANKKKMICLLKNNNIIIYEQKGNASIFRQI